MKTTLPRLAAGIVLSLATAVSATTIQPVTEQALTDEADAIVIGKVVGSTPEWIGKTLVTRVTLNIDDTLKGTKHEQMEVLLPGGIDMQRKIPVAMTYPGAPTLTRGENVFLFLNTTALKRDAMVISGFSQGKYTIETDESGQKLVTQSPSSAKSMGGGVVSEGVSERRTLGEFRQQVQGYLSKPTR